MRVRFTPEARGNLNDILRYIDERNPNGARNVKLALRQTVRVIAQFPLSGRQAGIEDVRVLKTGGYPYLIYWIVEPDEARIVHIRHAHRKPWLEDR
jgi:plasmid stabilization system protein ParE